ncbi:SRPBCC domain-containing protein [Thermotoga sp. KOL6]|uniref:SRPBCC family protein n=1 Tax=Thermotoga sp. KOL6 TaxID=126741 RepID=UPI000C771BBD|nr:SRPBCC domain-containing protein [Thermotoga sp. KOL6]PLV58774.1 ATPase [Thermotoga sp. KOL6]
MKIPPTKAGVHIKAPVEKVWKVFVNERGWDDWLTDGMRMEIKEGGKIFFRWFRKTFGEEVTDEGIIHRLVPPRLIEFSWNSYEDGYRSRVKMEFFPSSYGGTWVQIEDHTLVLNEKDMEIKLVCAVGWGEMLTLAKVWIEYGISTLDSP